MAQKILVVDDEPEIREMLEARLSANGYEVVTAKDGLEAVEKFSEEMPAMVILDVLMPRVDGFKVLEIIKNHASSSPVPIIMLTAKGESGNILKAQEMQATDYIIKPFKAEELLAVVKRYL